jgi:molecular chaperone GrpE
MSAADDDEVAELQTDDAAVEAGAEVPVDDPAALEVEPDPASDGTLLDGWAPEAELELLRAERDEYLDALRRLQADFDNFRKRTVRDQGVAAERLVEGLVVQLLPVLDSLDLALRSTEGATGEGETLRKGFELMGTELVGVLEGAGLVRIDAHEAPFDPELHEAVMQTDEGRDEPTVADVLRTGYRFKDKVVRPAMVRVAK